MSRLGLACALLALPAGCESSPRSAASQGARKQVPERVAARRRIAAPPRPRARVATRPRRHASPRVRTLPLAGRAPSSYVAPRAARGPQPVLVLLHGSRDRRTSACQAWARVGARRGWLLCPAGLHRTDKPAHVDRWTWGKVAHLLAEIRAGLRALEQRYPGRVDRRRLTLAGFSLGALLAHEVAYFSRGMFPRLILYEGVARLRRRWAGRMHHRGVRRVAYVCGAKTSCQKQVPRRTEYLRRAGITVRTFVVPGTEHEYGASFDPVARRVLDWVLAEPRPSVDRAPRRKPRR